MSYKAVSDRELNYLTEQLVSRIDNKVNLTDVVSEVAANKILRLDNSGKFPASILSGKIPMENIPHGALERCIIVTDDAARYDLTKDDVQVGDTVKVVLTNTMYYVVDVDRLYDDSGYEVYNSGSADKLTNARKIQLSGDVSGNSMFDGTNDININITVNSISGPLFLNEEIFGEFLPTTNLSDGRVFFKKIPGTTIDTSVIVLNGSLYGDSLPSEVGNENDMYFVRLNPSTL